MPVQNSAGRGAGMFTLGNYRLAGDKYILDTFGILAGITIGRPIFNLLRAKDHDICLLPHGQMPSLTNAELIGDHLSHFVHRIFQGE